MSEHVDVIQEDSEHQTFIERTVEAIRQYLLQHKNEWTLIQLSLNLRYSTLKGFCLNWVNYANPRLSTLSMFEQACRLFDPEFLTLPYLYDPDENVTYIETIVHEMRRTLLDHKEQWPLITWNLKVGHETLYSFAYRKKQSENPTLESLIKFEQCCRLVDPTFFVR